MVRSGREVFMQQQISVVTLGIEDLERSKRFYAKGFGWMPVFENEEIVFYQMNGFVLGTWIRAALEQDMQRGGIASPGAFSLAHNVIPMAMPGRSRGIRLGRSMRRGASASPLRFRAMSGGLHHFLAAAARPVANAHARSIPGALQDAAGPRGAREWVEPHR
jgi:catechol 2,3-dioxygenase-like lactoylglutathione lyase family enzyme